jgi:hypothetical protein
MLFAAMGKFNRLTICAKDIQRINGKSERTALNILSDIRYMFGKEKHQPVTLGELCVYMKIDKEEVLEYLNS